MTKQLLTIFTIAIFGLYSCKSIKVTDLRPQNPISNLLPSLEPQIDIGSFQTAYSLGTTKSSGGAVGYGTQGLGGVIGTATYFGQSTAVADKRIQDAIVLYEREIRENITAGTNKPIGYAVCRITTGETRMGGWGWYTLSILTLTVPNWFGMPFLAYKTELELEVEIKDCNNSTVGRYQGYGFKRVPVAAWHGYGGGGSWHVTGNEAAARKSNIDAVKMAMGEIKEKISKDSERLKRELVDCKK